MPGGSLTPALGQVSVYEVDDQTSSNPTVSRGSLAPPRHPRRGRGSGLVNVSMNNETLRFDSCPPLYGGWAAPPPRGGGQHFCLAKAVWCMPAPIWGAGRAPPPQGGAVLQQYHQGGDGLMKINKTSDFDDE